MSKWIAEFELEDGDTMPEHMDLEYKGAKIDFHCRPMWIPCSETIDIPDHEVLCCDEYGEELIGWLSYSDEQWMCASDGCVMYDPIAWREKPEPYREEGEK